MTLKSPRLRDELNNNDPGHGTAENHTIKSPSSGTSTEDIANIDTELVKRLFVLLIVRTETRKKRR